MSMSVIPPEGKRGKSEEWKADDKIITLWHCDMCGKEIEQIKDDKYGNTKGGTLEKDIVKSDDDIFDLCEDCFKRVANYIIESAKINKLKEEGLIK